MNDGGQAPDGERAQSGRAQGERAQGERAQGERAQGERAQSGRAQSGRAQGRRAARVRRRDSRGRGLRGTLTPQDVPLYRSRAQRFDDLVLDAVAQLEPRWEAELSGVEFAVEEIPVSGLLDDEPEPVPLARLDPAAPGGDPRQPARPARIVLYRRPLMARADDEDDLGELVLDVVVEEFARLLGVDPQAIDPGYPDED